MKIKQNDIDRQEQTNLVQNLTSNMQTLRERIEFQERQAFDLNQTIDIVRSEN